MAGTVIDAEYTKLDNTSGAETVSRAENMPVNSSPYSISASTRYRLAWLPAAVGVAVSRVGRFYTDTANTIKVNARTLVDTWTSYDIGGGTLRVRGRNLTAELYADWADYNPGAIYLGAPRSFDSVTQSSGNQEHPGSHYGCPDVHFRGNRSHVPKRACLSDGLAFLCRSRRVSVSSYLGATGSIYLFNDEINDILHRDLRFTVSAAC